MFILNTNPYDYEIGHLIIKYINMKLVSLAFQDHRNVINVQNNNKKNLDENVALGLFSLLHSHYSLWTCLAALDQIKSSHVICFSPKRLFFFLTDPKKILYSLTANIAKVQHFGKWAHSPSFQKFDKRIHTTHTSELLAWRLGKREHQSSSSNELSQRFPFPSPHAKLG